MIGSIAVGMPIDSDKALQISVLWNGLNYGAGFQILQANLDELKDN